VGDCGPLTRDDRTRNIVGGYELHRSVQCGIVLNCLHRKAFKSLILGIFKVYLSSFRGAEKKANWLSFRRFPQTTEESDY
jgi:hypothetical protein